MSPENLISHEGENPFIFIVILRIITTTEKIIYVYRVNFLLKSQSTEYDSFSQQETDNWVFLDVLDEAPA